MKVLVADDMHHVLESVSLCVRDLGHDVLQADNGYAAFRILQDKEVDILLTDMEMPGMKGGELIEWCRKNKPSIKTILMSGHPRIKQFAADCKADAYIEKGWGLASDSIRTAIESVSAL